MTRPSATRLAILPALCAVLASATCAKSPVGPSLTSVEVQNVGLRATIGDPTLCCCRATGTATNRNTVPVHVSIKFAGYDGTHPDPITTIFYFIQDLQPGASHTIDAPGFIVPCSAIHDLKYEVEVKGITYPPL